MGQGAANASTPGAPPLDPAKGNALGTRYLGWVWGVGAYKAVTSSEVGAHPHTQPKQMDCKGTAFAGVQGRSPAGVRGGAQGAYAARLTRALTRSTSGPVTTSGAQPCASQRSDAKSACSRTAPPPLMKLLRSPVSR